ncbi:hypothetical protein EYF80_054473 [Liparis tanakae]|uniref:Uncharacterized protein n=1 Tax=Liparis tanakae TaxID=230148 RepID=A0A4Z2F2K3_9TELE|nr:hypothetical protein EYF80_054473 [Liparis tanakae]
MINLTPVPRFGQRKRYKHIRRSPKTFFIEPPCSAIQRRPGEPPRVRQPAGQKNEVRLLGLDGNSTLGSKGLPCEKSKVP